MKELNTERKGSAEIKEMDRVRKEEINLKR